VPHKDPDVAKAYFKARYATKRDEIREQQREYRDANRETLNARRRERRAATPGKQRDYRLRWKYGITMEEYDSLAKAQNHLCVICGVQPTGGLVVDHCHNKGHVRGLLCINCNLALGHLKDDVNIARAAVKYLSQTHIDSETVEEVK
jgi:hypothetical protein